MALMSIGSCSEKTSAPTTIKVSYPASTELSLFDPARVQLAQHYFILENLYSTLIGRDLSGALQPELASNFGWEGDEIFFEIPPSLKASDGLPITAEDVVYSFKRLIILGTSTHGDLSKIICDATPLTNINDQCSGLRQTGNKVYLRPKTKNDSIFDQIATIDFAVIPKRTIDPQNLSIQTLQVTSGRYFVQKRDQDGKLHLGLNTFHPQLNPKNPEKAIFIPTDGNPETALNLFTRGEVDFVSTLESNNVSKLLEKYSENPSVNIHSTAKIRLELIHYTSRGLKLSPERRLSIGNKIKRSYLNAKTGKKGIEVAYQYFPEGGHGSLDEKQIMEIRSKLENASEIETGEGLIIGALKKNLDDVTQLIKPCLPGATFVEVKKLPEYADEKEARSSNFPHLYIITMDTGFLELMPTIINTVKSGFFGSSKNSRSLWLDGYLLENHPSKRKEKLRTFHYDSLALPVIIPIVRTPYMSVLRSSWKGHFSNYFPNVPLWQITAE